jgi:ABC-type uncharacterized transport system permease subunit
MQEVIGILAGVFLSGVASLCIGLSLFRQLEIQLERTEYRALAFVAGSACFSQIIFVLSSIHLARKSVFLPIALLTVGVTIGAAGRNRPAIRLTPLPLHWKW